MTENEYLGVSRYDLALCALPLPMFAAAVGVVATGLPSTLLVGAATLACVGILVDVLYVHAPTED